MSNETSKMELGHIKSLFLHNQAPMTDIDDLLGQLEFTFAQRLAIVDVWNDERLRRNSQDAPAGQEQRFLKQAADLRDCNPVYLLFRSLDAKLDGLTISANLLRNLLYPFVGHIPAIPTPQDVIDVRQALRPFVQDDLEHYQASLKSIHHSLTHAESILQRLYIGPDETEDLEARIYQTLGDLIPDDDDDDYNPASELHGQ